MVPIWKADPRKPLTKAEIKELRADTIKMLDDLWIALDYTIGKTSGDGQYTPSIWRETSTEETGVIADSLLALGAKSATIAALLRGANQAHGIYGAGHTLIRNAILTALHYQQYGIRPPNLMEFLV